GSFFLERAGRLTRAALTPGEQTVFAGESAQFVAQAFDQFERPLKGVAFKFESSDAGVAAVEGTSADAPTGEVKVSVKGLNAGVTKLTATAGDGTNTVAAPPADLFVKALPPRIARVAVSPSTQTLNRGGSLQLNATAFDENDHAVPGITFTWSSGASSVATVDASGLVSAVGVGAAEISARTSDNRGSNV